MSVANFGISPILISIITSLVVGGAVFIYFRKRIAELESLHMQQAQILRSFISRNPPQAFAGVMPIPGSSPTTSSGALGAGMPVTPSSNVTTDKSRITISDGEAESSENDSASDSSEYEYSSDDNESILSSNSDKTIEEADENNETRVVELENAVDMIVESALVQSNMEFDSVPHDIKMIELAPVSQNNQGESARDADGESSSDSEDDNTDNVDETEESSDSVSPVSTVNYRQMKVDELRSLVISKGIVNSIDDAKKIKKQELVTLLSAGATISIEE